MRLTHVFIQHRGSRGQINGGELGYWRSVETCGRTMREWAIGRCTLSAAPLAAQYFWVGMGWNTLVPERKG